MKSVTFKISKAKIAFFILCLSILTINTYSQSSLVIVDPFNIYGTALKDSLTGIYPGAITIADSLPPDISGYNAAFIYLQNSSAYYKLTKAEGNEIITYLKNKGQIYLYGLPSLFQSDSAGLLQYLGINRLVALPMVTQVDSLVGINNPYFIGIAFADSFTNGGPFYITDTTVTPVVEAKGTPLSFNITYIPKNDSIKAVIDVYYFSSFKAILNKIIYGYFNMQIDGVNESNNLSVKSFSLSQNYPNPFNPSTIIRYSIPKTGLVTLKVYDILGREVTTLVNENKTPGNYSVTFNGNNLSSGIYFYRISAGRYSETKKFILLK